MNTRILLALAVLSGGLMVSGARAQPAPATADAGPVITAHIKCLGIKDPVVGVDILLGSGKRLAVTAYTDFISQTLSYQGPARLTLVRSLAAKTASATAEPEKPEVLAVVELPPAGGDFLLLFSGSPADKLYVMAVPFSSADVPASSCLVWNVTARNLGVSLGGQKAVLASGQRQLVHPSGSTKNYYDLKVFDEYQGQVRPLISGAHYLDENSRQLLFIVEKVPGQAPVVVRTIEELPEKPKQTQVAMASRR